MSFHSDNYNYNTSVQVVLNCIMTYATAFMTPTLPHAEEKNRTRWFRNARAMNEGVVIFFTKSVAVATSLDISEK